MELKNEDLPKVLQDIFTANKVRQQPLSDKEKKHGVIREQDPNPTFQDWTEVYTGITPEDSFGEGAGKLGAMALGGFAGGAGRIKKIVQKGKNLERQVEKVVSKEEDAILSKIIPKAKKELPDLNRSVDSLNEMYKHGSEGVIVPPLELEHLIKSNWTSIKNSNPILGEAAKKVSKIGEKLQKTGEINQSDLDKIQNSINFVKQHYKGSPEKSALAKELIIKLEGLKSNYKNYVE
jgi:hypothetical protein